MPGRPAKARHRAITALNLQRIICRLFGFVQKFLGQEPGTLSDLLRKEYVTRYTEWCINERKLGSRTVAAWIGMIPPLAKYPLLEGTNFAWVRDLANGLPRDKDNSKKDRKARKWVEHDRLYEIPRKLFELAGRTKDPRRAALHGRDGLLVLWLLVCPWRQKNVRSCRIVAGNLPANLFFAEISPLATIAKPRWVEDALKLNPHQAFWQFHFDSDETKNADPVDSLLPRQLIGPLETYLAKYRPLLIKGPDPGTLFLNESGGPLSACTIARVIGRVTLKWTERRVTPHLFRDIVATKFLADRPKDYLTLSKMLWHRNLGTTLQLYGANFDASYGARGAEEWLDEK
jgi:integrase